MSRMTDTELARAIKHGELANVYLLYGKEQMLLETCTQALVKKALAGSEKSFNLHEFSGNEIDLEALEDAVESLPMMAARKCVTVHDLDVEKLSADETAKLKALLQDPPETTVLLFYYTGIDVDLKKTKKFKPFADWVDKVGVVVEFGYKTRAEISRALIAKAQAAGCYMSDKETMRLIQLRGENLRELMLEMDKLISFAAGSDITVSMIDSMVTKSMEESVFELSRAMCSGNHQRCFEILQDLFYHQNEPIAILGAVNSAFLALYRAKCGIKAGKTVAQLCEDFDYKGKEFVIKKAASDCAKFHLKGLGDCIDLLYEADLTLKSKRCQPQIVVETLVVRMIAALSA